jgi:thiol-disulfide isomerase/thioredoxin
MMIVRKMVRVRHFVRVLAVLISITALFNPAQARSPVDNTSPVTHTSPQQTRLVVFEAFMRQGCGLSRSAGEVIDGLAPEYAGQPVVFIEYDIDSLDPQFKAREQRWWDAYQIGGSVFLPLVMVDSGNQFSNNVDEANVYRDMIDTSLARPPQAEIEAYWQRVGDSVKFTVQVTNLSDIHLSSTNDATVWGIVYEDEHVANMDHYVRAVASDNVANLAPGASMTYTLQTTDLTGVDWSKLHYVALVDYRPNPDIRPHDTLQAVVAQPVFSVQPDSLTLMVDPVDATLPEATASLSALGTLDWTAETSDAWLTITPTNGNITVQPTISVMTSTLAAGWQQGTVTFTTTSGDPVSDTLDVKAFYGTVERIYLPCVMR